MRNLFHLFFLTLLLNPLLSFSRSPSIQTVGKASGFLACKHDPSAAQRITVSGSNLTDFIHITAPAEFELAVENSYKFTIERAGGSPPSISLSPANTTVCEGSPTTFTVSASGATNHQWQVSTNGGSVYNNLSDAGVYSNVTTPTLSISNTTGLNSYMYRCVVSNADGDTNSDGAALTALTCAACAIPQFAGSSSVVLSTNSVGLASTFQSFIPTCTGNLTNIRLTIVGSYSLIATLLSLNIYNSSGGTIGSGTPDLTGIGSAGVYNFSFNEPVVSGETYYFGFSAVGLSLINSISVVGSTANPYPNGGISSAIGGPVNSSDVAFLINITPTTPDINLKGNGVTIDNGDVTPRITDHTDFGSASVSSGTVTRTFTIENTGAGDLTLGTITGATSDFSITQPLLTTVPANGSTTFTVTFDPTTAGKRTATISIANNDTDEAPYTFAIEGYGGKPFITTWKTNNPGASNNTSITIPTTGTGYNYDVDWNNDGTYDEFGLTGNATHNYGASGTYTVAIRGDFPRIFFNNVGDMIKILSVTQWGDIAWASMGSAFLGCHNLTIPATDAPNLAGVTDMSFMFGGCTKFNEPLAEGFNTTTVTKMNGMFYQCTIYNKALPSSFNTTNVTDMNSMFFECSAYDQALPSSFNTASVTDMRNMFFQCSAYNKALPSSFNTVNVTDMRGMFYSCDVYNQALPSSFNTSNVTNMSSMFNGCDAYDQALPSSFNTAKVTDMGSMFERCYAYNKALPSSFNTAAVESMRNMFYNCRSYDQPLPSSFNTASVTNMDQMFLGCDVYNQALPSSFNTVSVTSMVSMFLGCDVYNQALPSSFNTANVTDMRSMFGSCSAFDQALPSSFNTAKVTNMSSMFAGCSVYNQPFPSSFTTTKVTEISSMFSIATAFNQDISSWDMSKVIEAQDMFSGATAFNQDISGWNVSKAKFIGNMFYGATAFNQNLGAWNLIEVVDMTDMLKNSGLSVANYDATLIGWNTGGYTNKPLGDASPLQYCAAQSARSNMIDNKGWAITGDSYNSTSCLSAQFTTPPSNATVCLGASTSFSIAVSYATSYSWQVNTGSGFNNLSEGGVYSGVNATILNISNVTGLNGYQYRCVASNANGNVNSDAATLTVVTLTAGLSSAATICVGANIALTATSGGTYTWTGPAGSSFNSNTQNPNFTATTTNYSGVYSVTVSSSANCSTTATIRVTVNANPSVSLNPSSSSICIGQSINLAASGGSGYVWAASGGTFNSSANPATFRSSIAGGFSFTVTATNTNTCSASATASVTVNANPSVSLNPSSSSICIGQSINLEASGGSGYVWSASGGTFNSSTNPATFSSSIAGGFSFTVTATNTNTCSASATASVTVGNASISVIPPSSICAGVTINLTASGGSSYSWVHSGGGNFSSSSNPVTFSSSSAGGFNFTVTATVTGGCTATATTSVSVKANPTVGLTASSTSICAGATINLEASGGSGYVWSASGGTFNSSSNPATFRSSIAGGFSFTVTATNTNTCSASATASVTVNANPSVSLNPSSSSICIGQSINLEASGGSGYVWAASGGTFNSSTNPATFSSSIAGEFSFTVTATNTNTCSASATASVTVNANPNAVINPSATSICAGGTINLTASGGSSYSWSTSGGTFSSSTSNPTSWSTNNAGGYTISVTAGSGTCTATASTSITVNNSSSSLVSFAPICALGNPLNLSASGGSSYSWKGPNGFKSNIATPSKAKTVAKDEGIYSVTVGGTLGCTVTSTIRVYIGVGKITATSNSTVCKGGTIQLSATAEFGASYKWTKQFGSVVYNGQNPSIPNAQTSNGGVYIVFVTGVNGCMGMQETLVVVSSAPCTSGRIASGEEEEMELEVNTYPNPTSKLLTVEVKLAKPSSLNLQLFNATGNTLSEWELSEESTIHRTEIDLSEYKDGLYLIQAQSKDGKQTKRVMKVE